jgi:hypothetical protein
LVLFLYHLSKRELKESLKFFAIGFASLVIALPQLYFLLQNRLMGGFGKYRLGWMVQDGFGSANFVGHHSVFSLSYLNFLWINFGLLLPILLLGLIFATYKILRKKVFLDKDNWQFLISGLVLFIWLNIYQFQPWDFDNNKLIIYGIFFVSLFVILFIEDLLNLVIRNLYFKNIIITILVIFMSWSGLVDIYNRFVFPRSNLYELFDREDLEMAKNIDQNTPKNAVILSSTSHRNIAIALAGRSGVMGYDGWLWSRGINYSDRQKELNNFFIKPSQNTDFLTKYNIGYVLIDDKINSDFGKSLGYFDQNFAKINESPRFKLYKIK